LDLDGHDFAVTGRFTNQGTLVLRGTENVALTQDTAEGTWQYAGDNGGRPASLKDFGAVDYFNLVIASPDPGDLFSARSTLTVAGDLTLAGGTYNAAGQTTAVAGDWAVAGGAFLPGGGTVVLTGAGQHISGSASFFNLTKVLTLADTLTFQAGS